MRLAALLLALAPACVPAATLKATLIANDDDPRFERARVERAMQRAYAAEKRTVDKLGLTKGG
jgi:hypothetical protein